MRATLMLGILCTGLATVCGASAQGRGMSRAERAGYDYGWDAANFFCQDLRAAPIYGGARERPTREFSRGCKVGFDDHIDNNRTCKARIRERNMYTEMWEARRDNCS